MEMDTRMEIVNPAKNVMEMEFAQINVRKARVEARLVMEMVVDKAIVPQVITATRIVLVPTDVLDWHSMVEQVTETVHQKAIV